MLFQGLIQQGRATVPDCLSCPARRLCERPKRLTQRESAKVLIVTDYALRLPDGSPTREYHMIKNLLGRVGFSMDDVVTIPCMASDQAPETAWAQCQPLMIAEIQRLNPTVIIPWGKSAIASVLGWLWGKTVEMREIWYGYQIPCRELNAWVVPMGRLGGKAKNSKMVGVADVWAYRHLKAGMSLTARPYKTVPEYKVRTLYNKGEIVDALAEAAASSLSAFDYESTGLKPDQKKQKLISCGVSWLVGDVPETVAFCIDRDVVPALKNYLVSPSRKVAANAKFEVRWSKAKLGVDVTHVVWDTLLAAHWENPTKATKGLKFQAFARLGVKYFAGSVEHHFEDVGPDGLNMIHRVPLHELLLYNGIDAVAELDLAILQMRENGITTKWNSVNLPGYEHGKDDL